jgi:Rieske Fe-S protein
MTDTTESPGLDRRHLLGAAAAVGFSAPLLAACGAEDTGDAATEAGESPSPSSEAPRSSEPRGAGLVATADVPVGGGVVVAGQKVVVTQPSKGDFKAFSAVCTHQGCLVSSVEDGTITCACHGSRFSAADGTVQGGPATAPLGMVAVAVEGDQVVQS